MVALFNGGRYAELESRARVLLERYPESGFVWKLLGASLRVQGKDALPAMRKAAGLLADDAEAHSNLGVVLRDRGQLDAAAASYRRALEIDPGLAQAHRNLGNVLRDLGQLDAAAASYRHALEIVPDSAEVHNSLGVVLKNLGRFDEAEASCRRALEIAPGYAEAHNNLGNVFRAQGRDGEAAASYRRAIGLKPDYAMAFSNLGVVLQGLGHPDEAEPNFRRALEIDPGYVEVLSNLGVALQDLGRLDEAAASFRRALEIAPDYIEALGNLGVTLQNLGQREEALASYRRALEIKPDYVDAHLNLGNILKDLGYLDEAAASYRRALEIRPDCIEAHLNVGNILKDVGRIDEAVATYRRALEIAPDYVDARLSLAQAGQVKAGDENMAALMAMDESVRTGTGSLTDKEAVSLHFALGKCYDDIGDPENAFPHFLEGGRLKRATLDYDAAQTARIFAGIMRNFDAEAIRRLRDGGDPSPVPVFILGMPRSGTTLVEQIVASHPEVYGAGELPDLMEIAQRSVAGALFPGNPRQSDWKSISGSGAEYVDRLQRRAPGMRRITDKTPQNFLAVGLIHLMLPNAKIVHVMRNPVDTCLSCFTQLFTSEQNHTYDLAELGRYYRDYFRLMQHWREVLPPGAFLDVQYEDIVADKEEQSRRIVEYCGLEWDDACLDFHKNKRAVQTASVVQVRQPIYRSSVERWRKYEKFLGPLLDALGDLSRWP